MTSTSFNTGYSLNRNSSKVIQPPGGQTADIFGSRSDPSYSSASSQAGSDVASSRVHIETDQQSIGGSSHVSQPIDGMLKQVNNGQTSPNDSVDSARQLQQQQPLLMADDYQPSQQQIQQQSLQNQPMHPQQQQQLIQMQQQSAAAAAAAAAAADVNRSPKKTIPVIRRNPITGEIYDNPSDRQQPIRVRQPPGGRSSGIF